MEYLVTRELEEGTIYNGKTVFNKLQNCFDKLCDGDIVYLRNEIYYGRIFLRQKNITIIGMDESVITYDAYHGMKKREIDNGDGVKVYGTTGSSTFTAKPEADGLRMFNVTIQNTHSRVDGKDSNGDQAVAFKTEATNGYFEECKFLGYQDTLYTCGNDNVFNKCFIAGTVDFIFGSGNTIFDKCIINIRAKDSEESYLCAPNTRVSNTIGLFFYKCMISSNGINKNTSLGRPWFDKSAEEEVMPRALYYMCHFPSNLELKFDKMKKYDDDNYEMHYYKCIKDNKEVSDTQDLGLIDFYLKIYEQRR